jgi:hypothetical protein
MRSRRRGVTIKESTRGSNSMQQIFLLVQFMVQIGTFNARARVAGLMELGIRAVQGMRTIIHMGVDKGREKLHVCCIQIRKEVFERLGISEIVIVQRFNVGIVVCGIIDTGHQNRGDKACGLHKTNPVGR